MNYKQKVFSKQLPHTQQDINQFLFEVEPIEHTDQQYQSLLKLRQKLQAALSINYKYDQIIRARPHRNSIIPNRTNICQCCYEEIFRSKMCKICGLQCCAKCLVRFRILPGSEDPVPFCQNCDNKFMQAMVSKQLMSQFGLRNKALKTLANQYQMMQSLFKIQKHKIMATQQQTGETNQLLSLSNRIIQLKSSNHLLKTQLSQLYKKIDWGTEINKNLQRKKKKLSKFVTRSFASSIAESDGRIAAPQISFEDQQTGNIIQHQNLNQSLVNSMLNEEQNQQVVYEHKKCQCVLF